jgi:hypothetical protein
LNEPNEEIITEEQLNTLWTEAFRSHRAHILTSCADMLGTGIMGSPDEMRSVMDRVLALAEEHEQAVRKVLRAHYVRSLLSAN